MPVEVEHLLDVMEIKGLCRTACIAQIDAGPKGAVIGFHQGRFPTPRRWSAGARARGRVKVQPDHRLVFKADWDLPEKRLRACARSVQLATLAAPDRRAA